jgi:cell division protein FtsI/penicillin-binding protein 2
LVFSSILILKLFFVQVIHKNVYAQKADKQYATPSGDIFNRGTIFFSKKDGSLVAAGTISSGFKLAINTKDIVDKEALYSALDPFIEMDHDTFITHASKKNDPYEEVATHLTKEQADNITSLGMPGVSVYKDNWRFYPGGSLASQTLGFLAYKKDDRVGQYGLERYYNSTLSMPKDEAYVNFFAEVFSNLRDSVSDTNNSQGDVVTTIEPSTQHTLESELGAALHTWNADQAGGIIINPQNGEIYAMTGLPDFDLNNFGSVSNIEYYKNPIVESVFEFGSVIKPLVMAAALDVGALTPETTYVDKGVVVVNKKEIHNFDLKARGLASMQTVLDQSLNTGMVFVESKLGHENMRSYMKAYGIGEKTGIDLPNETSGLIKNLESPRDIEYANAAFGQGIALTPIEAVRAFSAITNGGNLITPHLVKQIRYDDGLSKVIDYPITRDGIIKKETSNTISRMLVHVFESYDNGGHKFEHYSVGSKTGTAQVAMENGKGYYEDRHMHSFFGYFPAYDPKFLVFLFLKNPKQVKYASQTLIPPFINISKFLMNYYDVPPDR